jgi:hypothetical protein
MGSVATFLANVVLPAPDKPQNKSIMQDNLSYKCLYIKSLVIRFPYVNI